MGEKLNAGREKGILPSSSVVKKNLRVFPSLQFPLGMTGLRSSSVDNATQCCRKAGGSTRGCISLLAAPEPVHQHHSWRSCNYCWNLLWMRGRAKALINRLLKIPLHFPRDEGTITSVSWPDSTSLLSAHLKFLPPLPLPFTLEKLSFASSPNDSRVMLLVHN